ncbi:MAG: AAA family ATPase [Verrucomicrobiota bacterium]
MPSLLLTEGPLAGRRLFLEPHEAVLGRANADVTIEDPLISRRHAVIRSYPPNLEIEDLGSLNGTWVNGERLSAARSLRPGDLIRLGNTVARVEAETEAERATISAPSPFADVRDPPGAPPGGWLPTSGDELRTVTALFADLVGSTALGEQLAPHDVKAVIGECVTRMSREIERFGGNVQAYMGDGVAAFFGVPLAHEDDPERAARAGLAILDAVRGYAEEVRRTRGIATLGVRVGINTGTVAVGLVGAAEPQAVSVGDTTNVAARLQAAADPGTIVVGQGTARALIHRFALEPLGELRLKGRSRPLAAWRLVGTLTAGRPTPSTSLVGRQAERDHLRRVLDELDAGRGQILLLVGESGIGKTRLLTELHAVAGDRVTWLEGQCLSYGTGLLYGPFIQVLRDWIGITDSEQAGPAPTQVRAKLELVPGLDLAAAAPLGRLLGISPGAGSPESSQQAPTELRVELRLAYRAWLGNLAERGPVVLALEDLHRADVSTCELAGELLQLTEVEPLLVVGTLRPDPQTEGWQLRTRIQADYPHRLGEIGLAPLAAEESRALLDGLPSARGIDSSILDEIVAEAEGNPLYLEEMLNATASGLLEPRRRTWVPTVSIPTPLTPTLESVLLARIDQLPSDARYLAQTAAVVGRRFPPAVLERLAGRDVSEEIAVLLRAAIIYEDDRPPDEEYAFRHGLLRETAYATLPPSRRRELHGAVGEAFEALWGPVADDRLEVLAHHFALSNSLEKGLLYLEQAAERASALEATARADELWRRALLVAERLGDEGARERLQVRLVT